MSCVRFSTFFLKLFAKCGVLRLARPCNTKTALSPCPPQSREARGRVPRGLQSLPHCRSCVQRRFFLTKSDMVVLYNYVESGQ